MEDELLAALVESAVYNDINTVSLLLAEQPALINAAEEEEGNTALMIACEEGHVAMVTFLLQHGASVEKRNAMGSTAVHHACSHGHVDIVRVLADKGADLTSINQLGKTPLISAAFRGHPEVVSLLLRNADVVAQVNHAGKDGRTAFFLACINGHVEVARLLRSGGADHTIAEMTGKTPLAAASSKGYQDCVALVEVSVLKASLSFSFSCTRNIEQLRSSLDRSNVVGRIVQDMERRLTLQKMRSVYNLQGLRLHSPGTRLPKYVEARADDALEYPRLEIVGVTKHDSQKTKSEVNAYTRPQEISTVLQFVVHDLPRELFVELLMIL